MDRRVFTKAAILLVLEQTKIFSQKIASDSKFDAIELELLGINKPVLCGDGFMLRNEVYEAFHAMKIAGKKDGISLWVSSGYRSFEYQKGIWNLKFKTIAKNNPQMPPIDIISEIIQYSAIPGTSRHHWGTDIDLVDAYGYHTENPLSRQNFEPQGVYQYLSNWLENNAIKFGFVLTYTKDENRTGFSYEPWHYSYEPLSKLYYQKFLHINLLALEQLKKCSGIEIIDAAYLEKYMNKYFKNINPLLK